MKKKTKIGKIGRLQKFLREKRKMNENNKIGKIGKIGRPQKFLRVKRKMNEKE